MRYIVEIPEVHYNRIAVEAENEIEACEKAENGDGNIIELEYSHTLNPVYEQGKPKYTVIPGGPREEPDPNPANYGDPGDAGDESESGVVY